jgi:hypothetical protein
MGEEAELDIDQDLRMPRRERATCQNCGCPLTSREVADEICCDCAADDLD